MRPGVADAELTPAPWPSRLRAAGLDAVVIGGGVAAVAAVGFGLRALAGSGAEAPSVRVADAAGAGLLVVPAWLYLTVGEVRHPHGTWGKRRAGLRVTTAAGSPPGVGRVAVRNLVKLVPWQLAHIAVARLLFDVHAPIAIAVANTAALVLPVVGVTLALHDPWRRGLHDLMAGTLVTSRPQMRETEPHEYLCP